MHIVCPHCDKTNRIPPERLSEAPKCGSCHRPLFTGHPIDLTAEQFRKHTGRNDIPVIVDFWAPWCGPCKMMAPAYAEAAGRLEPRFRLVKLNTEVEQQLAAEFGIRSIPTMAIFSRGAEIARRSGAIGTADIVRWAEQETLRG